MKYIIFFAITLLSLHNDSMLADTSEYQYMDALALASDPTRSSGKGSNWHNYTEVYSKYLAPYKDKEIKFLEIGIFEASGVKFWESYLQKADLHFIDITFDRVKYFSNRSHYYLADQANIYDLRRVIRDSGGNYDIIIDDGGHTMSQQIVSFVTLFPELKSGGLYIVEDTHTSYWKDYGGNGTFEHPKAGPATFIQFAKNLIDDVNYIGAHTLSASHANLTPDQLSKLTIYQREIYSIHFYDSLCIIIKR